MTTLPLVLLLAAVPAGTPIKVAVSNFSQVGLSPELAAFYSEHVASKLAEDSRLKVTSPKDIVALLGLERQKQLLGCSDESSSCVAEFAGALGVNVIVTGQLAKLGKNFQLNVKALAADGSRMLFVHSSKLIASEEDLIGELNETAQRAAATLVEQLGGEPQVPDGPGVEHVASRSTNLAPLVPIAAGLAVAAVGAGFLVDASQRYARLNSREAWPQFSPTEGEALRNDGSRNQVVGIALVAVGAASIVGGAAWMLLTHKAPAATVAWVPGGGVLLVSGSIP